MLLAVSLSFAFTGKAQITYRGFVEGGLGASIISNARGSESDTYGFRNSNYGGGVGFSYMLATTHGIQLKNNFFGIGLGITPGYCAVGDYYYHYQSSYSESAVESLSKSRMTKISIPAYFNWRYDFFGSNGTLKPYVGVKAGVFLPVTEFEMRYKKTYSDGETYDPTENHSGSLPFFAIDLGLRKRISESSGLSFGISVQNSNDSNASFDSYGGWLEESLGISILAKIAFDF